MPFREQISPGNADRRKKKRFRIQREVKYKVIDGGAVAGTGVATTLNMSSSGIALATEAELAPGLLLEVSVTWPALLDEVTPMKLVIFGRVVRSSPGLTVVGIERYEFRTQAKAPIAMMYQAIQELRLPQ